MMCDELTEEGIVLVKYEVVESYARADKDLFHTLDLLDLTQHMRVLGVIHLQILTRCGGKTLFAGTNAALSLLVAGGVTEVSRRSADVIYIALEVGHGGDKLSLLNNTLLTS